MYAPPSPPLTCRRTPDAEGCSGCYDWAHPAVSEAKLAMVREVLEDYGADGIELDFLFVPWFFKPAEVVQNTQLMTEFVRRVRATADEVAAAQQRPVSVYARVFSYPSANAAVGLDPAAWLREGLVDALIAQSPDFLFETQADVGWAIAAAAEGGGAEVFYRPARRLYDERSDRPSPLMYRAIGQCLLRQGSAGLCLHNIGWPFSEEEHTLLRECAQLSAMARRDKLYLAQPAESPKVLEELLDYGGGYSHAVRAEDAIAPPPPHRTLPAALVPNAPVSATVEVADDLEAAAAEGELRRCGLTLRFSQFCVEVRAFAATACASFRECQRYRGGQDTLRLSLNGEPLLLEEAERSDERARSMALSGAAHGYTGQPMFEAP